MELEFRNTNEVRVHIDTLQCATANNCIPCLYKVSPSGLFKFHDKKQQHDRIDYISIQIPPNQRPEMCPRAKSNIYNGIYSPHQKILTIGDGDFSFSLAIARHFGKSKCSKNKLFCTSYESYDSIMTTYPTVQPILSELNALETHVFHEIDATNLSATLNRANANFGKKFDIVIWNFPCIRADRGGADGQVDELQTNIDLIRHFFMNVNDILRIRKDDKIGEVHITHKTIEPFRWWDIVGIANACGWKHVGSIVFDRCLYPGYVNRKVLDKKSFPLHDALTYVFRKEEGEEEGVVISRTLDRKVLVLLSDGEVQDQLHEAVLEVGHLVHEDDKDNNNNNKPVFKRAKVF